LIRLLVAQRCASAPGSRPADRPITESVASVRFDDLRDTRGPERCRLATRFTGGDPLNFRAGDTNVGQFAIGQVREFAPHRLVPPPGLISADDGSKHGLAALSPAKRRNAAARFVVYWSAIIFEIVDDFALLVQV
jgi:hypothetical protein